MKIYPADAFPQGSTQWLELRCGRPTASSFDRILTPVKEQPASAAEGYLNELIAERLRGGPEDVQAFVSRDAERGQLLEEQARRYYALHTGLTVRPVGFVTTDDGRYGCSPDGLIYDGDTLVGGLELKCPKGSTHTGWLLDNKLPTEHKCQVHGGLVICKPYWWDFLSYAPPLPPFYLRTTPDGFTVKLAAGLDVFCGRLEELLQRVKAMH